MGINDTLDIQELVIDQNASGWFTRNDACNLDRYEMEDVIDRLRTSKRARRFRSVRSGTPAQVISMRQAVALAA